MNSERVDSEVRRLLTDARPEMEQGWRQEALTAINEARASGQQRRTGWCARGKLAYALGVVVVGSAVTVGLLARPSGRSPVQARPTPVTEPAPIHSTGAQHANASPLKASDVVTPESASIAQAGQRERSGARNPSPRPQTASVPLADKLTFAVVAARGAADGDGRPLQVGSRVSPGTTVRSAAGGRLTLITRHGSEFTLDAKSEIALARDGRSADLQAGRLYCRNREHEFAAISTAAGKIVLLGTVVDAAVKGKQSVAVTVVQGKVRLANAHGEALVSAGKKALLVAQLPPNDGTAVNVVAETAWYDGRGSILSEYGDISYLVRRGDLITEVWTMTADGDDRRRVKSYLGPSSSYAWVGRWLPGQETTLLTPGGLWWDWPDFQQRRADSGHRRVGPLGTRIDVGGSRWLLNVASGQDALLIFPPGSDLTSWDAVSPDGSKVAFSAGGSVWVHDLSTEETREVVTRATLAPVSWSPDGSRLVASVGKGLNSMADQWLVIVDVDTGNVRELGVQGASASFSPDGTKLVYCGDFDFNPQGGWNDHLMVPGIGSLFVLDVTPGAEPLRLTPPRDGSLDPHWSPEGTHILYETMQLEEEAGPEDPRTHTRLPGVVFTEFVVRADGSGVRQEVYHGPARETGWAPLGDAIYVTTEDRILLVAADGSGVTADLGGNVEDSILSPQEQAQTEAAARALQEAVFEYTVGVLRSYESKVSESKAAYQAAADIFARLPWQYPLVRFSTTDVLRYSDNAADLAARPASVLLNEACTARLQNLAQLIGWYQVDGHEGQVPDLAIAIKWLTTERLASTIGGRLGHWIPLDQVDMIGLVTRCPLGGEYVYTPPAPGNSPKVGDVLAVCPKHGHRVVWRQAGSRLYPGLEK